jgi:hypothetical protein
LLTDIQAHDKAVLSGILNWGEAILAPTSLGCRAPSWLWSEPGYEVVKAAFDQAVSTWCKYAYEEDDVIARKILSLAVQGVRSDEDYRAVEEGLRWRARFEK